MKTVIQFLAFFAVIGLFTACNNAPEGQSVEAGDAVEETNGEAADAKTFDVNTDASQINWTASKVSGQHNGTIQIQEGDLMVADGKITGGEFVLDMGSIVVLDQEGESKQKLENHLSSGDFFEAETYPTGTFTITSIEEADGSSADITHNVTGNLTLKGETKSVTLPANVVVTDNVISAVTPPFTINRTEWGINYRSGILGTAADKIINDEIGLVINLQATPAAQ